MKILVKNNKIALAKMLMAALAVCMALSACKKDKNSNPSGGSSLKPLITASGWQTLRSIPYSDPNTLVGGFDYQDILVKGDSVGVVYGETSEVFGHLGHGVRGEYKAMFSLGNKNAPSIKSFYLTNVKNLSGPSPNLENFFENLVFVNNSFQSHVFESCDTRGVNYTQFMTYAEADEDGNVVVQGFQFLAKENFNRANIVHTANGSVMFVNSNPQLYASQGRMWINYFDAPAKKWLSDTQPYNNGANQISLDLPNKPPLINGSWGFSTTGSTYRAMITDMNGGITVVRPNQTNYHCDTLAHIDVPELKNQFDNRMISGAAYGNDFYGLIYSPSLKKIYEYKWTEGSTTIQQAFVQPLDVLAQPIFQNGVNKPFEIKADGTAYQLAQVSNIEGGVVLRTINASGVKEIAHLTDKERGNVLMSPARYFNGYYYTTAYTPPGSANGAGVQMDIIRFKE